MNTTKPTKAQVDALASLVGLSLPYLPMRRERRTFDALYRKKLVDATLVKGPDWQRAGYVLTPAGRAILAAATEKE